MGLLRILKAVLADPLLVSLLLICAVFAALSVLQYFRASAPAEALQSGWKRWTASVSRPCGSIVLPVRM